MRVVDKQGRPALRFDALHATRDGRQGGEAATNIVDLEPQLEPRRGGGQSVRDVEAPQKWAPDLERLAGRLDPKTGAGELLLEHPCAVIGLRRERVGHAAHSRAAGALENPAARIVVDVDDGHRVLAGAPGGGKKFGKEARLRVAIRLHVAVKVEVVAAQVGKYRRIEVGPDEPVGRKAVARDLQGHLLDPIVAHSAKQPLQYEALGGRIDRAFDVAIPAMSDGTDQATSPSGLLGERGHHPGGGRLAVGSGDADHPQFTRGPLEKVFGDPAEHAARIVGDEDRYLQVGRHIDVFDEHRRGTRLDRILHEGVSVGLAADQGHEERPGLDHS